MQHPDPDTLALLALGESIDDTDLQHHLRDCPDCAAELDHLTHTATIARSTMDAGELVTPDTHVWDRIADTLQLGGSDARSVHPATFDTARFDTPSFDTPSADERPTGRVAAHRRFNRRRLVVVLAAAAAVVALAGSGALLWARLAPTPDRTVAAADLAPLPAHPDASGSATVALVDDGRRVVDVDVTAEPVADRYREVWLLADDGARLVSLGVLDGSTGSFDIPTGLDLDQYDTVDVSDESYDGDPAHSGDSIVRGTLG